MSSNLDLIAILSPKAGKVDRVIELLQQVAIYVEDHEPQTLRYEIVRQINQKSGGEEVILLESYKDKAALKAHGGSDTFRRFNGVLVEEDLMAKPMQLMFVKPAGGFSRL
ncbi:hypothetical protein EG329_002653 [Mollisiaceae sp. DMI_Dod_QoI]|nr:hypothetical protein EG329_002653 [Helotiales sp. DMI_Dod_QoI]